MPASLSRYGLPAIIALILISPFFQLPRPTNVSSLPWLVELLSAIFLSVAAVSLLRHSNSRSQDRTAATSTRFAPPIAFLIAFCIWSLGSAAWAQSPTAPILHTLVWANYAIVLVITLLIVDKHGGKSIILRTFIVLSVVIGVLCCFDFLTVQDFAVQEGSLRIRYGKFAELLVTIAPLVFSASLVFRGRQRLVIAGIGLLAWTAVMLSLSKGAFLAGACVFLLMFLLLAIFKSQIRREVFVTAGVWIVFTICFQLAFSALTALPSTAEYISGGRDATRSTSTMRIYSWKVAREMTASHLLSGVGANNFGISVNQARRELAETSPSDPDSAIGEDYIFERAHNEPLQIAAELGIVGAVFFAGFVLAVIAVFARAVWRRGSRLSPIFYGGLAGIAGFAASSMVSSFSFRAFQNGAVFFMVLGLTLTLANRKSELTHTYRIPGLSALFIAIPILLALFSASKGTSQYIHLAGERTADPVKAVELYETAARLDPDNAGPELAAAERFVREKRWTEAVPYFQRAIEKGFGVSVVYSYLANAQEQAGDLTAAAETLREAREIYPRSVFLRIRSAITLEKLGRDPDAQAQIETARSIDPRQANGWYSVIKDGILNAHLHATSDPANFAAPPELLPENAIHAYNDQKAFFDEQK